MCIGYLNVCTEVGRHVTILMSVTQVGFGLLRIQEYGTAMLYQKVISKFFFSLANKGGMQGYLTLVHEENIQARRELLWKDLSTIADHILTSPWLVTGEFQLCKILK